MSINNSVIIVDDHPIFRDGLKSLLSTFDEIGEIELAINGENFIQKISSGKFDIALVDIRMPDINGIEAISMAKLINPTIKFLVVSAFESADYIDQAIQAGASGYLLKDSESSEIKVAIQQIINGYNYFSPRVLIELSNKLNARFNSIQPKIEKVEITEREREILYFISLGYSRQTIAHKLFISERTVDKHKENLLQKTKSSNSVSLLLYAIKNKLIDLEL